MMASPIHSRRVALAGGFTFDMAVRQGGVFPSDERERRFSTKLRTDVVLGSRCRRRSADDEVDELERLRRENLRLKRQLEEKDMVVELLKKVKEFERM